MLVYRSVLLVACVGAVSTIYSLAYLDIKFGIAVGIGSLVVVAATGLAISRAMDSSTPSRYQR